MTGTFRARQWWPSNPHLVIFGLSLVFPLLLMGPRAMPTAEAAFPGRNGRIVLTLGSTIDPTGLSNPYSSDYNLFSISSTGSGLQQLTQGPAADFEPAWSPMGGWILFARAPHYGGSGDIYLIDEDESEINVTQSPLEDEADPTWSPDLSQIVFSSSNEVDPADLYVMDLSGDNKVRLVAPGVQDSPAWSPDGNWIAYRQLSPDQSNTQIWLVRPDGSGAKLLVDQARVDGKNPWEPNWSPDGKRIAFSAMDDDITDGDLWAINADGTGLARLGPYATHNENDPVWSPDGKKIAFVSNRSGEYAVYKMNPDGTHVVRLLNLSLDPFQTDLDWGRRP